MGVVTKYISKVGRDYKISPNFGIREMACKDGSDKVLYSTELMDKLEELRAYVGGTIGVNSGYRTTSYNKKIGGASNSNHTKGYAADIVVKKDGKRISGKLICCLCQTLGFKGIAFIKGSGYTVHVDMRPSGTYRGDERYGYSNNVGGDFYEYFGIKKSQIEALKSIPKEEPKKEIEKEIKEDEEMTQEQFNKMMDAYLVEKANKQPDTWSKEAREWAENNGIIQGTGDSMNYKSDCTREQMVTFLYRVYNLLKNKN